MSGRKCPHCGNTDENTIQHNGCKPKSPDLTLLCLARVEPGESSLDKAFEEIGPDGLVVCAMQWEPNR